MKTRDLLTHSAIGLCLVLATMHNVSAGPVTILDNYYGATGTGDIVGDSRFEVDSMVVDRIGSILSVKINTNFVNNLGVFPGNTTGANQGAGMGIGLGDLFLTGDGWNPFGSAPYAGDDASNGTNWTYGFALDNRWNSTDLSLNNGKLYSLTSNNNDVNSYLSDDFITSSPSSYRSGQEVSVDSTSAFVSDTFNTGTWLINQAANSLSFQIDVSGTNLATSDEIALHWGMTCANDVIEGSANVSVPAPPLVWMIGVGLIGLAGLRKYKTI